MDKIIFPTLLFLHGVTTRKDFIKNYMNNNIKSKIRRHPYVLLKRLRIGITEAANI